MSSKLRIYELAHACTSDEADQVLRKQKQSDITKQIIATGLAREGIEAVKNMRDTNWLKDTLSVNGCYDFATGQANQANCYVNWLGQNGSANFLPSFLISSETHLLWENMAQVTNNISAIGTNV